MEKADEILKKYEDLNEHHFYEIDRNWIITAMEEYKNIPLDEPVKPEIAEVINVIDNRLEYYNQEDEDDEYLTDETKDGYYKTGALEALETLKEIIQKQFSV